MSHLARSTSDWRDFGECVATCYASLSLRVSPLVGPRFVCGSDNTIAQWVQLTVAVLLLRLLAFLNNTQFTSHLPESKLSMFNRVVAFNLLPYPYIQCSLPRRCRCCFLAGLLLPFTIVTSVVQPKTRPNQQVILGSIVVTIGFLIGSAPAIYRSAAKSPTGRMLHESAMGLYGTVSSIVLTIHAVLKRTTLGHVGQSAVVSQSTM
ncbi:hypothetical protein C8R44DRAFT_881335 [Mycena epipterygia]|nr:hypothetical protein C8R44DRAFT_881335 [Mycena epipterygia]